MFLRNTTGSKFIYNKANTTTNHSLIKSFVLQDNKNTINLESYPIKPSKNIIPQDINLKKIFLSMKNSSQCLSKNYSNFINYNTQTNDERKSIINKIKEYFILNHIEHKIFFKTILLYDILIIENEKKKLLTSFEEIAFGALILSIKFNYIENKMLSMKKFLTFFDGKTFKLQHLIEIERKCLQIINYYLNYNTPMCFLEFFLINGIIYDTDTIKSYNYIKIYLEVEKVLEIIMKESNRYLKYNFFYLVCSIVYYCRSLFQLVGWPSPLKKTFGVNINDFQVEYKALVSYKDLYNNNCDNNNKINIGVRNNLLILDYNEQIEDKQKYEKSNYSIYNKNANKNTKKYKNNIINININNYSVNSIYNTIFNNCDSKNSQKLETFKKILDFNNSYNSYKPNNTNNFTSNEKMNRKNLVLNSINTINNSAINNITDYNSSDIKDNKKGLIYISPIKTKKYKNNLNNKKIQEVINETKNKEDHKENHMENNKENHKEINKENIKDSNKDSIKDNSLRKIEINETKKIRNYNFTSRFKTDKNNKVQKIDLGNTSYKKDKIKKYFNIINADIKKSNADMVKIKTTNRIINHTECNKTNKYMENKKDSNTLKNNRSINNQNLYSAYKKYIVSEANKKKNYDSLIKDKRSYDKSEKYNSIKNKKNNNNIISIKNGYNKIINKYGNTKVQKLSKLNDLNHYSSSNKESLEYLRINDYITPKKIKVDNFAYKIKSKEDSKNDKSQTNENKIKYNNLIKYKLSISSSLNKNKEERNKKY